MRTYFFAGVLIIATVCGCWAQFPDELRVRPGGQDAAVSADRDHTFPPLPDGAPTSVDGALDSATQATDAQRATDVGFVADLRRIPDARPLPDMRRPPDMRGPPPDSRSMPDAHAPRHDVGIPCGVTCVGYRCDTSVGLCFTRCTTLGVDAIHCRSGYRCVEFKGKWKCK